MDLGGIIGLAVWFIFLALALAFCISCILSLIIAPFRAFFVLRFVLKQKAFYFAKAFFVLYAALLLSGAFGILTRACLIYMPGNHVPSSILIPHVLFKPDQGLAYAAFELAFFGFRFFLNKGCREKTLSTL